MSLTFTDNDKVSGSWISWKTIGQKVQGTLVDRRQKPDTYNPSEMQWIYELLTDNNEILIIGGKVGIDMQMKYIKIGQIVELRYEKDIPPKKPGQSPTKVIQVYTRPDAMNKEWLAEREENIGQEGEQGQGQEQEKSVDGEINVEDIPFKDDAFAKPTPTQSESTQSTATPTTDIETIKAQITELAKIKLGVTNDADVQRVVMEKTGLAYINSNIPSIFTKLQAM